MKACAHHNHEPIHSMPQGFFWLIAAQFFSGLADNTLLIVTMAWLKEQGYQAWWAPLLKFAFTWAYVLLAPFVGTWADTVRKDHLMGDMNAIKLCGALTLALGGHPLLAFAMVGMGASAYAPAKYGLITETVPPGKLVAANGWLEVSVVLSVLLGTGLGGWLVSGPWDVAPAAALTPWSPPTRLLWGLLLVLGLYVVASLLNLGVPRQARSHLASAPGWAPLVKDFWQANQRLWRDPLGGLSLTVTTIFWGAGAVVQFAVFHWAEKKLRLPLDQAAYLQATVALGVVVGAGLAAHRVALNRAASVCLPWGVALGVLVAVAAQFTSWRWAVPVLTLTGAVGGALVVPMNALLQYRGHRLLSPGRSIAVQGFNENLSVLLMLGMYALLLKLDMPIVPLMTGFGLLLAASMTALWSITRRLAPATGGSKRLPPE
jgi:MFS transporter, LPLT family, lysophospholipid transporter